MTSRQRLARLVVAFILAWTAAAPAVAQQASERSDAVQAAWGLNGSDLTPHPGLLLGVLPNGMRYAVMRNASPAGGLSARLRFDVGATSEEEREQGYLHLIEHLIFHGSTNIPEGALPLMLAHRGLKRLTDFNAFTSFDETVYRLDLGMADHNSRDAALMLMREISSHLAFSRRAVEGAKRMVRDEIRARDTLQDRIMAAQHAFLMPGSPLARGPVAGSQSSIKKASGPALRRLYERYYVPSRATLVLVGDFDPAIMEAELKKRFGDWQAGAPLAADRPPSTIKERAGIEAHLFVDAAAPTSVTIGSVAPLGRAADVGRRRDWHYLEYLGSQMLNRRLARITAQANALASANVAIYDHFSAARLARIEVAARDRDWRGALRAGATELQEALDDGFLQAELDEQLAAGREALARDAAPRTSSALAEAIIDAAGRGIVFTQPADRSATEAYLSRVQLSEVNAAFKAAWARSGRLIFVTHNNCIPGAEAAIMKVWNDSSCARAPRQGCDR